eukprot:scaffold10770_cov66-Phaeocystis_antarctica.AAC.1
MYAPTVEIWLGLELGLGLGVEICRSKREGSEAATPCVGSGAAASPQALRRRRCGQRRTCSKSSLPVQSATALEKKSRFDMSTLTRPPGRSTLATSRMTDRGCVR